MILKDLHDFLFKYLLTYVLWASIILEIAENKPVNTRESQNTNNTLEVCSPFLNSSFIVTVAIICKLHIHINAYYPREYYVIYL